MALYLVWIETEIEIEPEVRLALDFFELQPGLLLIDSDLTRSKLYHRIKWALPKDTALLCAPLADAPKFKGMETGALNWVRARNG